ncbi:Ferredoxin, 2Fe-2S [Ferriphaselus amnicola]|uniref:Ferredoxin, 2Fe-2S n=1 Tax=Ferriphaselus amnicola TaxID=1188319 RepID=A0A2Z6G903_9PROT|nr:(2Fe-2S) ferredoxin domain-containing protein [Ferriphaselus amnicola]BBE49873.1 Ferredoxin, 2Fe-2S [Ferriphaselus amnicola]
MSFYDKHVFFCTNQREPGEGCCNDLGAQGMRDYTKDKVKALGLPNIRINSAGCLGRCDLGPVLVVYPEETWYTYLDESDLDEIIDSHLKNGQVVERLKV